MEASTSAITNINQVLSEYLIVMDTCCDLLETGFIISENEAISGSW